MAKAIILGPNGDRYDLSDDYNMSYLGTMLQGDVPFEVTAVKGGNRVRLFVNPAGIPWSHLLDI